MPALLALLGSRFGGWGRVKSMFDVVSKLARQTLRQRLPAPRASRNGLPLLPVRLDGQLVDLQLVNNLRDELPIWSNCSSS